MRLVIFALIVAAAGVPGIADAQQNFAPECAGIDLTNRSDVATCIEATEATRSNNMVAVIERQEPSCMRIVTHLMKIRAGAENNDTIPPAAAQRIRALTRPLAPDERFDCSLIAAIVAEYRGTPPVWVNCLGVEVSPDPDSALLECVRALTEDKMRESNSRASQPVFPPELIPMLAIPTRCRKLQLGANSAMMMVNPKDPDRPIEEAYLPDGITPPNCSILEPLEAISTEAQDVFDALRAERSADARERGKIIRSQPGYKSILERSDEQWQARRDTWSDEHMAAVASRQQDSSTVEPSAMRRALIVEMQRQYPKEVHQVGDLRGELRHHSGGVQFRSSGRSGIEVNMGISSVAAVSCGTITDGATTCSFEATRSSSARHRFLGGTEREAMDLLVNAFDLPPTQTASFEEGLVFTDGQWRLSSPPSIDLVEFLTPEAPQADLFDEEMPNCEMLYAVGASFLC